MKRRTTAPAPRTAPLERPLSSVGKQTCSITHETLKVVLMNSPQTIALKGRKIVLRDWLEEDLSPYEYWLQPGHRWHDLDGPYYPLPDAEQRAKRVDEKRAGIRSGQWPWPRTELVIADGRSNVFLGRVVRVWESEETWWLSVGIDLYDPEQWGAGRGYEALGLWVDYLFAHLPEIVRVDLRTWSGNTGMVRLALKLGFREEARFRKARIVDGRHFDGLGFGVLREEWETAHSGGFIQSQRPSSVITEGYGS